MPLRTDAGLKFVPTVFRRDSFLPWLIPSAFPIWKHRGLLGLHVKAELADVVQHPTSFSLHKNKSWRDGCVSRTLTLLLDVLRHPDTVMAAQE